MNDVVSADRVQIGFFGCRNAGKSSLVNAVTAQQLSVVSDTAGTTTDPVKKAMELLPVGPVVIVDTPGFDDTGALGQQRVARTKEVLRTIDVAILVIDVTVGARETDRELIQLFEERGLPYLVAWNKSDVGVPAVELPGVPPERQLWVSAACGSGIQELKEAIGVLAKGAGVQLPLIADKLQPGDLVILVVPIDAAAPKGRLILPQQQTIRDILDADARALVVKETELAQTLADLRTPPALVITDSQVFGKVREIVPEEIRLTSFSILMARKKGFLELAADGVAKLDQLKDGDHVLICEGCTHHRQCGDIGTQKLPDWLRAYTGKQLEFTFTSGKDFSEHVDEYALVIHCGGCMLTEREVRSRMEQAAAKHVPVTNYGTAIAQMNGILARSLEPFPELKIKRNTTMLKQQIDELEAHHILPREQFVRLLNDATEESDAYLFERARAVREQIYGNAVYMRGLIEFTNYCKNDCYYCGIRRSAAHAERYRLSEEQILDCCKNGYELGFRTFVLQGGEDAYFTDERIVQLVREIKARYPDCAVTLSIGERERESYQAFFDAGADRYLLRHETADEEHYRLLHPPELHLEHRKQCLRQLKEIGYQVGCGFMVGSPGQTAEHLVEDLLFIHELEPHMVGIGPFIPHHDTPFANEPQGGLELTLRLLAIIRLMQPHVLLPATTALGTIDPRGREKGLLAGANVVMPNLSPGDVRKKYLLYDNKICTGDEAAECVNCLGNRIASTGYELVSDRGDYK